MRNKKGSMELSVNSIVILVIAIVIMGLILGFIKSKFAEVGGNLVANEPDPQTASSDDRMQLSRESISTVPGSNAVLKVDYYNPFNESIYAGFINVTCSASTPWAPTGVVFKSNTKSILAGNDAQFLVTVAVSKNVARGNYLCTANAWGHVLWISPCPSSFNTAINTPAAPTDFPNPVPAWAIRCYGKIVDITPKDFVLQVN